MLNNNIVDLWVTKADGKRTKSQFPEDKAIEMARKLLETSPNSNPKIGYLY